jgi:hypothetical protein
MRLSRPFRKQCLARLYRFYFLNQLTLADIRDVAILFPACPGGSLAYRAKPLYNGGQL